MSIFATGAVKVLGPHQRLRRCGSVHAFHTSARGASKTRTITSSRSPAFGGAPSFGVSVTRSVNRSIVSAAPSSIPDASIPSRSSTLWNTELCVSFVLPPASSKIAVSTRTWPGSPSYSTVPTSRLGGSTSRYSPWTPNSFPSASRWTSRQRPPGRTSILSTTVEYRRGPHHLGISLGSVHAFHTSSRGASNVCVVTSSRSDFLTNLLLAGMFVFLLSSCITGFFQVFIQSSKAVLPQDAVSREPSERRAQRSGVDLASVHAALRFDDEQAGIFEHVQMPRDGRQAHIVRLGELADDCVTAGQLFQNRPANRMGQRRKDGVQVKGDRGSINHLVNRYVGWIFNDMVKRPFRTTPASPGLSRETVHQAREPWGEKDMRSRSMRCSVSGLSRAIIDCDNRRRYFSGKR